MSVCVCSNPKVYQQQKTSFEISHFHSVFVFYYIIPVAFSLSPLILFVICQTRMSEAHSHVAHFIFFLPSLVTTSANFRQSAHIPNSVHVVIQSHFSNRNLLTLYIIFKMNPHQCRMMKNKTSGSRRLGL